LTRKLSVSCAFLRAPLSGETIEGETIREESYESNRTGGTVEDFSSTEENSSKGTTLERN
jgi:hypothetical protein